MKNSYEILFVTAAEIDPTDRLCAQVLERIERREVSKIRTRAAAFGFLTAGSIIAFVPAVRFLSASLGQSGLGQYVSLFLSDGTSVMTHWQDALFSMASALPVTGLTIMVALAIVCLACMRRFSRYINSLSANYMTISQATSRLS